jgi:hypothetical protein
MDINSLPGFRRRFRVTPGPGCVQAAVEDDFHCMAVTVHHRDGVSTAVDADMLRAPWTTCPGAVEAIQHAFRGVALRDFDGHGDKTLHCTHLYDLALLAAAHALDEEPLVYDILVSDPVDGVRQAEIRRNSERVIGWSEAGFHVREPEECAGMRLDRLGRWIATLEPSLREPARLLRWGNMLANGRTIPMERQSDASRMPATCFTFQPHRAREARRIGQIRDFSAGAAQPLSDFPRA